MDSTSPPATSRPLAATAAPRERHYANHLRVGFNRLEFLLDFAQVHDRAEGLVHVQLVASPAHAKQFVALMQGCIDDYESRYGAIPLDTPAATPGGRD